MYSLKKLYDQWQQGGASLRAHPGLSSSEYDYFESRGWKKHKGKVRDSLWKEGLMVIFHSDRLSAGDRLVGEVPYRGALLVSLAGYWFEHLPSGVAHHYIKNLGQRLMVAKRCEPLAVEVLVRSYRTGSFHKHLLADHYSPYKDELSLEEWREIKSLPVFAPLPKPLVHLSTKASLGSSDESISSSYALSRGWISAEEWHLIQDYALKVLALGTEVYKRFGWVLADTKFEFGRSLTPPHSLMFIDEVLTPDCSRLWLQGPATEGTPESWDKDIIRQYLQSTGAGAASVSLPQDIIYLLATRYLEVCERIQGKPFMVESLQPIDYIQPMDYSQPIDHSQPMESDYQIIPFEKEIEQLFEQR